MYGSAKNLGMSIQCDPGLIAVLETGLVAVPLLGRTCLFV